MSFLNALLLGGMAAFSLPLIIHILNKRRYKNVQWGAMHLLAPVLRKNKQRIRIEQWLLLLLRIAIPVILALCLARPVTRFQVDEAAHKRHVPEWRANQVVLRRYR